MQTKPLTSDEIKSVADEWIDKWLDDNFDEDDIPGDVTAVKRIMESIPQVRDLLAERGLLLKFSQLDDGPRQHALEQLNQLDHYNPYDDGDVETESEYFQTTMQDAFGIEVGEVSWYYDDLRSTNGPIADVKIDSVLLMLKKLQEADPTKHDVWYWDTEEIATMAKRFEVEHHAVLAMLREIGYDSLWIGRYDTNWRGRGMKANTEGFVDDVERYLYDTYHGRRVDRPYRRYMDRLYRTTKDTPVIKAIAATVSEMWEQSSDSDNDTGWQVWEVIRGLWRKHYTATIPVWIWDESVAKPFSVAAVEVITNDYPELLPHMNAASITCDEMIRTAYDYMATIDDFSSHLNEKYDEWTDAKMQSLSEAIDNFCEGVKEIVTDLMWGLHVVLTENHEFYWSEEFWNEEADALEYLFFADGERAW